MKVNTVRGQTNRPARSKTHNYIKPGLNGKSNNSRGSQPHEHPDT